MFVTPHKARIYLLLAAFFLALPGLSKLYKGYEGKFLVATQATAGTPFEQAVIYVEKHELFRAYGFIVNKPISRHNSVTLYNGGPVAPESNRAILYAGADQSIPSGFHILCVSDFETAVFPKSGEYRAYAGYAGWAPLQLDYEVMRGGWYVLDYDPEIMFHTPPEDMWRKAMERVEAENPVDYPDRL